MKRPYNDSPIRSRQRNAVRAGGLRFTIPETQCLSFAMDGDLSVSAHVVISKEFVDSHQDPRSVNVRTVLCVDDVIRDVDAAVNGCSLISEEQHVAELKWG